MPYTIKEEDGQHCVYNSETDDKKACHETREQAESQVKLLHELEKDDD